MKNNIQVVIIAWISFVTTACGLVTQNPHDGFTDAYESDDVTFGDDPIVAEVQPEAGSPSVSTGGSSGNGAADSGGVSGNAGNPSTDGGVFASAGTQAIAGTNNMNIGGELAVGGATSINDAAGAPSGGTPACPPRLIAEWNTHYEATGCPGTPGLQMLAFTLKAECQDIEVKRIMMTISSPDFSATDPTPYCKASCVAPSDWFFRNLKLQSSIGSTLMGPLGAPTQHTSNDLAHLTFWDAFSLKAGESKLLILTTDIAATFISSLEETHYRAFLLGVDVGDGNIPYVVVNHVSPDKAITVKQTCP